VGQVIRHIRTGNPYDLGRAILAVGTKYVCRAAGSLSGTSHKPLAIAPSDHVPPSSVFMPLD
jgi:hypothetical protein